jgi:hypothetical protein
MDLTEIQHEPTGMSFREWLDDPRGLPTKEPIGLIEIREIFYAGFGGHRLEYRDWLEGLRLCVAALVQRGLRPMLPNYETGKWEWTDGFNGENGDDDAPKTVAEMAVLSWNAFGDSGGAEHLRFGTRLPDGPLPEPSAYYPTFRGSRTKPR